jgi:hypothetical protein
MDTRKWGLRQCVGEEDQKERTLPISTHRIKKKSAVFTTLFCKGLVTLLFQSSPFSGAISQII